MTIKELIDELNKFSQDKIVVIEDADTNWLLNITSIKEFGKVIQLHGRYRDEFEGNNK